MEELSGINKGGLSNTIKLITHPLHWQGITNGWILPDLDTKIGSR